MIAAGANADGRRWSQVGLLRDLQIMGDKTKLILINLILWWKQGKLTASASGGKRGRGRPGCKQI